MPGCQTLLSPSSSEPDTSLSRASSKGALKSDDAGEEGEAVDGKLSIFIHKREDQSSHEVLQPLLRYDFTSYLCFGFTFASLLWVFLTLLFLHAFQNVAALRGVPFDWALEQTWKKL